MKFLYFTDPHLSLRRPESRKDDYSKTILQKITFIAKTAAEKEVNAVICGGDFFDRSNEPLALIEKAKAVIEYDLSIPWYFAPGQHEMDGYNRATLKGGSSLGRLTGRCSHCEAPDSATVAKNAWCVNVEKIGGVHTLFYAPMEFSPDYDPPGELLIIHDMIVPDEVPWDHTLVSTLNLESYVKLVLTGDYHAPFIAKTKNGVPVVNPGALSRRKINEAARTPQALLIDMSPTKVNSVTKIVVPHKPPEEVFRKDELEAQKRKATDLQKFEESIAGISFSASENPFEILDNVANAAVKENLLNEKEKSQVVKTAQAHLGGAI